MRTYERVNRTPWQLPAVAALTSLALVGSACGAASAAASGTTGRGGPAGDWTGTWLSSDPALPHGGTSLADVRAIIGADTGKAATLTGAGVGIALLDTGIADVPGIPAAQVVNGPDLSFESQSNNLRYLDTYGHGTHMAGIIIGDDAASGTRGIAPKAKLTSVKLGTANGAVDVSQVVAGIDWVVAHRNDDPANPIRVINLSYGSGGSPLALTDPLDMAVERAWKAGIVVCAAAGNDGNDAARLANPASDPWVIAVAAATTNGNITTADDTMSSYSNAGSPWRRPDVLAPGQSILSLRVPGSNIDLTYPGARVGSTLFRGSGTSQATAVTSAAVALLLQNDPSLTPDQVRVILRQGTGLSNSRGVNEINLTSAFSAVVVDFFSLPLSVGTGTLNQSRGDSRVVINKVALEGEKTPWGPWCGTAWLVTGSYGRRGTAAAGWATRSPAAGGLESRSPRRPGAARPGPTSPGTASPRRGPIRTGVAAAGPTEAGTAAAGPDGTGQAATGPRRPGADLGPANQRPCGHVIRVDESSTRITSCQSRNDRAPGRRWFCSAQVQVVVGFVCRTTGWERRYTPPNKGPASQDAGQERSGEYWL